MIQVMITWAMSNGVTPERQAAMQKRRFNPMELVELKALSRRDLLALMVFCDIRLFDDTPVAAMTDDELRKAYVVWRGLGQRERNMKKRTLKRHIKNTTTFIRRHILEELE